ncbi:hypothetical protein ACP4OV_015858 [Aristida adscensionis]
MGGQDGKLYFPNSHHSNISTGQGSIAGNHAKQKGKGYPKPDKPPLPGPYGCPPPPFLYGYPPYGAYGYAYGYGYAPTAGPYPYPPPQHGHGYHPGGYPIAPHQGNGFSHGGGPGSGYGAYDHHYGHGGYSHGYGHHGKFSYDHSHRGKFEHGKFKHEHGKFSGKYIKAQEDPNNCGSMKCE